MLSNLPNTNEFSTLNFKPDPFNNKLNQSIQKATGIICTQRKVVEYILDNPDYSRANTFYALKVCLSYSPEYDLFSIEQERNYPTNIDLRVQGKCPAAQKSSKVDHSRMDLLKRGEIDVVKLMGSREARIRFSQKFLLKFTVYELEKKRKEIIDQTHLRMITEDDFKERVEVEAKILELKEKIKEYKPRQGCTPPVRRKKSVESKKPSKQGASRV